MIRHERYKTKVTMNNARSLMKSYEYPSLKKIDN